MKSRKLMDFIKEIQYVNRNPIDNSVLSILDKVETNPEIVINPGELLYRSRIIQDKNQIGKELGFCGYGEKDSFIPPVEKTVDMRANYRYIPYLYCSNNAYISIIETKPRFSSEVSVATLSVNDKIRLLDFTIQQTPKRMDGTKKNLFRDLSELFSKPVVGSDDVLDYIPTQYIAEYVKKCDNDGIGYDGIAFKSSLISAQTGISEVNEEFSSRFNIVIFNYNKVKPVRSNIYKIKDAYIECEQVDEDAQHKEINNPLGEALSHLL